MNIGNGLQQIRKRVPECRLLQRDKRQKLLWGSSVVLMSDPATLLSSIYSNRPVTVFGHLVAGSKSGMQFQ
jgi:hypothetical protein